MDTNYIAHHGVKGMRWGVRRYQNLDGSLTDAGRKRLGRYKSRELYKLAKKYKKDMNSFYFPMEALSIRNMKISDISKEKRQRAKSLITSITHPIDSFKIEVLNKPGKFMAKKYRNSITDHRIEREIYSKDPMERYYKNFNNKESKELIGLYKKYRKTNSDSIPLKDVKRMNELEDRLSTYDRDRILKKGKRQ